MAAEDHAANTVAAEEPRPTKFRKLTTSLVLILFTLAVGIACVLVLSCTLTQTRIASIAVDGVNVSIWKLDDIRQQWQSVRDQIHANAKQLAAAEAGQAAANAKLPEIQARYRSTRTEIDQLLEQFNRQVRPVDEQLAQAMSGQSPPDQVGRIKAAADRLNERPELQQPIKDILASYDRYAPVNQQRLESIGTRDALKIQITALQDTAKSLQTSLDGLFAQVSPKLDPQTRTRVENALFELFSGDHLLAKVLNKLIVTPSDILTLTLVILMGVLGSALQMTHALFKRNRIERAGVYFLRLSVGAITALVIFIVAKAGVPVIADATRLGGDAPINPYLVAFLAIISGLMSENAILAVQAQGARFFAPEAVPDQLRWARNDLHDAFTKANRSPDNVKRLLKADDNEFAEWISGKKAMPTSAQTMIAGVLEMPARELFTDIAPDDADDDKE